MPSTASATASITASASSSRAAGPPTPGTALGASSSARASPPLCAASAAGAAGLTFDAIELTSVYTDGAGGAGGAGGAPPPPPVAATPVTAPAGLLPRVTEASDSHRTRPSDSQRTDVNISEWSSGRPPWKAGVWAADDAAGVVAGAAAGASQEPPTELSSRSGTGSSKTLEGLVTEAGAVAGAPAGAGALAAEGSEVGAPISSTTSGGEGGGGARRSIASALTSGAWRGSFTGAASGALRSRTARRGSNVSFAPGEEAEAERRAERTAATAAVGARSRHQSDNMLLAAAAAATAAAADERGSECDLVSASEGRAVSQRRASLVASSGGVLPQLRISMRALMDIGRVPSPRSSSRREPAVTCTKPITPRTAAAFAAGGATGSAGAAVARAAREVAAASSPGRPGPKNFGAADEAERGAYGRADSGSLFGSPSCAAEYWGGAAQSPGGSTFAHLGAGGECVRLTNAAANPSTNPEASALLPSASCGRLLIDGAAPVDYGPVARTGTQTSLTSLASKASHATAAAAAEIADDDEAQVGSPAECLVIAC